MTSSEKSSIWMCLWLVPAVAVVTMAGAWLLLWMLPVALLAVVPITMIAVPMRYRRKIYNVMNEMNEKFENPSHRMSIVRRRYREVFDRIDRAKIRKSLKHSYCEVVIPFKGVLIKASKLTYKGKSYVSYNVLNDIRAIKDGRLQLGNPDPRFDVKNKRAVQKERRKAYAAMKAVASSKSR